MADVKELKRDLERRLRNGESPILLMKFGK